MLFAHSFTRFSAIAVLSATAGPSLAQVPPMAFTRYKDTATHWAAACIEGASVLKGDGNGQFRPNATMNRAEFAAFLIATFPQQRSIRKAPTFVDVPRGYWAQNAIATAYARGYLSGYPNGSFQPAQAISRAQALTMWVNAQTLQKSSNPDRVLKQYFEDAQAVPDYAKTAIASATQAQQVVNYPNVTTLRPLDSITRGEVATLVCQMTREGSDQRYRVPPEFVATLANRWRDRLALPESTLGDRFTEGLAPRQWGFDTAGYAQFGYVNRDLKPVLPGPYRQANPFKEGLAMVQIVNQAGQDRWGFINPSGDWVVPPEFGLVHPFYEGLALVSRDSFPNIQSFEVINSQGKRVFSVPTGSTVTAMFSQGRLAFSQADGKWGFLDPTGAIAVPAQFEAVEPFSEGLAQVTLNGKIGFINREGALVIPAQFAAAQSFQDGLAAAKISPTDPWGYLDPAGKWAIAPQFVEAQPFSEGLAGVRTGTPGKWGFVDRQGQWVIPAQYSATGEQLQGAGDSSSSDDQPRGVEPFREGLAVVRQGQQVGLIDRQGQWRLSPQAFNGTVSQVSVPIEGLSSLTFLDGSTGFIRIGQDSGGFQN